MEVGKTNKNTGGKQKTSKKTETPGKQTPEKKKTPNKPRNETLRSGLRAALARESAYGCVSHRQV